MRSSAEYNDLYNEGVILIIKAIDNYKANTGVNFFGYALSYLSLGLQEKSKNIAKNKVTVNFGGVMSVQLEDQITDTLEHEIELHEKNKFINNQFNVMTSKEVLALLYKVYNVPDKYKPKDKKHNNNCA